jgi:guanosine-3',5'-bis(diphosphate) 3'-pyrophosphohydrolase
MAASPPADWPVERRRDYVAWTREVAAGLRGVSPWLEGEFDLAVKAATEKL